MGQDGATLTVRLRIATRASPLARWQAQFVARRLCNLAPHLSVELVAIRTSGDRLQETRLARAGGKGLFVKELELALLAGRADLAVHSMKDVPVEIPAALHIPVILERDDPRDVLIAEPGRHFADLRPGGRIGSSSLRRRMQLRRLRPDLEYLDLRGNVGTRLRKLRAGEFHAIILAAAGIKRLGLDAEVSEYFPAETMVPAIGQGAIGVECRKDASAVLEWIQPLDHAETHRCIEAERAFNECLGGGCDTPIAAFAAVVNGELRMRAVIGDEAGTDMVTESGTGNPAEPRELGLELGRRLLDKGGRRILERLRHQQHI